MEQVMDVEKVDSLPPEDLKTPPEDIKKSSESSEPDSGGGVGDAVSDAGKSGGAALPQVYLRGVGFAAITEGECVEHILEELDAGRGGWVVTPNLDILRRLVKEPDFAALTKDASVMVADGMPLVWASKLQGTPLPERVAGSNLILSLNAGAAKRGRKVFLLGGDEGTSEKAAEILQERYEGLDIVGTFYPPFGFDKDEAMMAELTKTVVDAQPDIVFVALGCPKQEKLIIKLREQLPGAWWLGVGISFSFVCGEVKRAPKWMQKIGMEWVHRLWQEPGRLFRRYVVDDIPFAIGLLVGSFFRRFSRKRNG